MAYHYPFYGNDAALFAHLHDSQPAHALPLHVHLGLHHATVRMVIAPCIGSALYTNVLQHRQQYYVTRFAQDYDRTSLETAKTYDQTVRGMQYQGKTETEAQNMAAMSAKGKVQVQATLVSIKEMAGWTFYGCLICAGLMLVIPWRKRNIKELTRDYLLKNVDVKSLGRR